MQRILRSFLSSRTIKMSCNQKPGFLSDFHLSKLLNIAAINRIQSNVSTPISIPFIFGVKNRVIGRNVEHPVKLESITHAKSLLGTLSNQEIYNPHSFLKGEVRGIEDGGEGDGRVMEGGEGIESTFLQFKPITINLSNTMQSLLKKTLKDSLLCVNVLKKRRKAMKKHKHRKRLRLNRKKKESNQI